MSPRWALRLSVQIGEERNARWCRRREEKRKEVANEGDGRADGVRPPNMQKYCSFHHRRAADDDDDATMGGHGGFPRDSQSGS